MIKKFGPKQGGGFSLDKRVRASASKKYSCPVLLKGFYPILSDGERSWILPFGNSALAKAGSGDVLTGILTSLLAQGLSLFQAALLAVILQGETAEQWLKEGKDRNSFSSSEIINGLALALSRLRAAPSAQLC